MKKILNLILELEYIDIKVRLEASSDETSISIINLASALMSEAKKEGYGKPQLKMKLKYAKPKGKVS